MSAATQIPGYVVGIWDFDPVHSDVSFSVRHMMVSKVKGRFGQFAGTITTAEDVTGSVVTATLDASSIDTRSEQRDGHIKSADFFEVEKYPEWTFTSTRIEPDGDDYTLHGDLTIKGITKPVVLHLEVGGFGPDVYGGTRAGFTATTTVNRRDFGVDFSAPMEAGGVMVGDKIEVTLEIEAVLRAT
jgi:polyisoprenoid-binding protein YceI